MFIAYCIISLLAALAYFYLIDFIIKHWNGTPILPEVHLSKCFQFSIIIPARNEASNIEDCLRCIFNSKTSDYIEYEVIVIDDHSEDATLNTIKSIKDPRLRVLKLSESNLGNGKPKTGKKHAINLGLDHAQYPIIIQIDADTIVSKEYLVTVAKYFEAFDPDFLAGPISFSPTDSLLKQFQQFDIMGMMAVTAAGINSRKWYMANGANMVYKYVEDRQSTELASGDDVFAIQKIAGRKDSKIVFAKDKNLLVKTAPAKDFSAFINQRIRWATKNKLMKSSSMQVMMIIPFLNALLLVLHLPLLFVFGLNGLFLFLIHWLIKASSDYRMLSIMSKFYERRTLRNGFILSNAFHIIYLATIGLLSLIVKKYNWKGRRVH